MSIQGNPLRIELMTLFPTSYGNEHNSNHVVHTPKVINLEDYYGLNCVPPKLYFELLTPSTSEYDLIWRERHCRNN